MIKRIYVAASSQHVGKTTSTLGLMAAIREKGWNVGYCKPVGQRYVIVQDNKKVDKDALLFSNSMGFQLEPALHSPVIISEGITTKYIENEEAFSFEQDIIAAQKELEARHDFMIYEGTGHPGVGSVIDLSNADVASLLNAPVVLIVEGGIGKTIDRLAADLALFREKKVPCIGVIINKVRPEKLEKVLYLVRKKTESKGHSGIRSPTLSTFSLQPHYGECLQGCGRKTHHL
jgi:dethiobiotin synthetase